MYGSAINYYEKFLSTKKGWVEDNIEACRKLADCYYSIRNYEKELESILRSFQYDRPRPGMCCRLGFFFMGKSDFHSAIFWYNAALEYAQEDNNSGFVNVSDYTWLPNLQLCVCYDRLGNQELAYYHNELARGYRPEDERILHNKKYLESVLEKDEKVEKTKT